MSIRRPFRSEPLGDMVDRGRYYILTVDLPHVVKDDLHVYLDGNCLVIHAEAEYTDQDGSYNHAVYEREFTLPDDADTSSARVSFSNGILRITMDKKRPNRREIPVRRFHALRGPGESPGQVEDR